MEISFLFPVALNKYDGLHKHTPRTTGRVINFAFVGLYHFGNQVFSAFFKLVARKFQEYQSQYNMFVF